MKGNLKRILSLALLAVLLAAALNLPLQGLAPAARAEGDFVIENGVLVQYTGPGGNVQIPRGVTRIGIEVFSGRDDITGIAIPDTVTVIGVWAFSHCTGLKKVVIPKGVTEIGVGAFRHCTSLNSVIIPNTVDIFGVSAFRGCTGLKKVIIQKGVVEIGDHAFDECTSLTGVTIPNTVDIIGIAAFQGCTSLKKVVIPKGVTEIGRSAFGNCFSLSSITLPKSITTIGFWNFSGCVSLKKVVIPKSVTEIGQGAFEGCKSLTGITLPKGIAKIGQGAFAYCTGLKKVTIPEAVTAIETDTFRGCTGLTSVQFGNGLVTIGSGAFRSCTALTDIVIPGSVTSIGSQAFSGCKGLTSVAIPDSIMEIAEDVFDYCSNLRFVTIPSVSPVLDFVDSAPETTVIPDNLLPPAIALQEGQTMVLPGFKGAKAEWSVLDPGVAGIVKNRTVKGLQQGDTTLIIKVAQAAQGKALTLNGQPLKPGKEYGIELKVLAQGEATVRKAAINGPRKLTLHPLGLEHGYPATAALDLAFTPASLPESGEWKANSFYISSNPMVAQVLDDGRVFAIRPGKATITAYTPNMKTAKVMVTVKGWVTSLKLKDENRNTVKRLTLNKNDSCQLIPEFNGDAAFTALRWSSSNPAVAYVNWNGLVTTISTGTAKITATTLDGSNKRASVVVTVE